ncbi:MAG TPA: histidine ammonia-lyase [Candidatus Udaeobacter sp.]|nr:histidine ammonia-lyase [Candidatus Udaeobacter sp.]
MQTTEKPTIALEQQGLSYRELDRLARDRARLQLAPSAEAALAKGRRHIDEIRASGKRIYGITTGLGALSDVLLSGEEQTALSRNMLLSHACGMGDPLPRAQVRAIMIALINDLCRGHSGISPAPVHGLVACLNAGITPVVPSQGSVGYLVHEAHIGLCLIGIGEAELAGQRMAAADALQASGLAPVTLGAKDGLSLTNGTRSPTGLSALAMAEAERLVRWADATAAMSFEALRGQTDAIDPELLALKPYPGLIQVGVNLRRLLSGSEILARCQGIRTQDALSLRSIPQIHGASLDQLAHVARQVEIELHSASDNPLVIESAGGVRILSNAHPHGQSLAFAADLLSLAVAELGSAAERRLDRLINPLVSGLPPFLVRKGGVNSGMMIAQYAAASLAAENRILGRPAILDHAVTSGLQEDDVSFATPAALKSLKIIDNTYRILAIELLLAAQALEFHRPARFGEGTGRVLARLRRRIPAFDEDRFLSPDLAAAEAFLRDESELAELDEALAG